MKYVCELCGTVYDEAVGDSKHGIPAGTVFEALPQHYGCATCGSGKDGFAKVKQSQPRKAARRDDMAAWHAMMYPDNHCESDR